MYNVLLHYFNPHLKSYSMVLLCFDRWIFIIHSIPHYIEKIFTILNKYVLELEWRVYSWSWTKTRQTVCTTTNIKYTIIFGNLRTCTRYRVGQHSTRTHHLSFVSFGSDLLRGLYRYILLFFCLSKLRIYI